MTRIVTPEEARGLRKSVAQGAAWNPLTLDLAYTVEQQGQQIAAILNEITHAEANGHRLAACQGVGPGENVPAVRIEYLRAALRVQS